MATKNESADTVIARILSMPVLSDDLVGNHGSILDETKENKILDEGDWGGVWKQLQEIELEDKKKDKQEA